MPPVIPYVPQRITVHLGPPNSDAKNVTVDFSDYVKNVASSEIYPTWEESALRANILAIVSFALCFCFLFGRSKSFNTGLNPISTTSRTDMDICMPLRCGI